MGSIGFILVFIFVVRAFSGGSITIPEIVWAIFWRFIVSFLVILITVVALATIDIELDNIASFGFIAAELAVIWTPTAILRWIVVPLRMPRIAYWMVRLCLPLSLVKVTRSGGVIYGALALARKQPSEPMLVWLERKLDDGPPLRGTSVVAAGLLAALRNNGERARHLLMLADSMDKRLVPSTAHAIARDWLVVDAARQGEWRTVIRLGREGKRWLRWSYCMARISERLIGSPHAFPDWRLWGCFLLAPRRYKTYPLLRRALAVPRQAPVPSIDQAGSNATNWPLVLWQLAEAIEQARVRDGEALARAAAAVSATLDAMHDKIAQRLEAVGGRSGADSVITAFRQRLVDFLAPLIEHDPSLARTAAQSTIMDQTTAQVRRRLFGDIETRCEDYRQRESQDRPLDLLGEWEAWAILRISADRLIALDPDAERPLFQTMFGIVCNFAVHQHNTRKRIPLAHDMFAWLLRHSSGDPVAMELLAKNVQAGIKGL